MYKNRHIMVRKRQELRNVSPMFLSTRKYWNCLFRIYFLKEIPGDEFVDKYRVEYSDEVRNKTAAYHPLRVIFDEEDSILFSLWNKIAEKMGRQPNEPFLFKSNLNHVADSKFIFYRFNKVF